MSKLLRRFLKIASLIALTLGALTLGSLDLTPQNINQLLSPSLAITPEDKIDLPANNEAEYPSFIVEIFNQKQLNEQSLLALNWFQQSGEYMALTYQAFNLARMTFERAVELGVTNPAVVVDIDETILNNSAYQAALIGTNNFFTPESWNEWVTAKQATAIPGAVEFVNYVNAHGGTVFFISDRDESSVNLSSHNDLELATINNLEAVGFTGVNENTLILRGELSQIINGEENESKLIRRMAVENGNADNGTIYQIVALIGDNLNDFNEQAGINNSERRHYVELTKNSYGMFKTISDRQVIEPAYIILPNPLYGAWESGLYNPQAFGKEKWYQLSPSEKNQQRQESLIKWNRELPLVREKSPST